MGTESVTGDLAEPGGVETALAHVRARLDAALDVLVHAPGASRVALFVPPRDHDVTTRDT